MTDAAARLRHIDAIRGIAALAVVYLHAARAADHSGWIGNDVERAIVFALTGISDVGKIAVVLFFAISGYVVPFSLLRDRHGGGVEFAIGRFFRLYPAYWLSIAAALFVLYPLNGQTASSGAVLANVTMLQGFVGVADILSLYWTLQIELIFYGLCLALFMAGWLGRPQVVQRAALAAVALAIAMAAARWYTGIKLPVALPMALAFMFTGMLWRMREDRAIAAGLVRPLIAVLVCAIPLVSVLAYSIDYGTQETWYRYTISYYAALLSFLLLTTRIKLDGPLLGYLGTISYSIYLLGPIAQEVVTWSLPGLHRIAAHVHILVVMLATIGMAAVSYHAVEAPAIALGKRLARRVLRRRRVKDDGAFEVPL